MAGPGDPELLTLKARRLLRAADVVVYDRLVSAEILAEVRPTCERVFVGKKGGQPCRPQAEIDATLVALAREGKKVVRLKGGDPFIFGRGGEEAAALAAAGIPFEIVPGVTAARGAAAYSGIPLTHRAHSSAVVFLTGHEDPAKPDATVHWEDYARLGATLCVYMGIHNIETIGRRLQAGGMDPATPAAIVQSATTDRHRTILATLGTLAERARAEEIEAPATLIIGEVAACATSLAWFQPRRCTRRARCPQYHRALSTTAPSSPPPTATCGPRRPLSPTAPGRPSRPSPGSTATAFGRKLSTANAPGRSAAGSPPNSTGANVNLFLCLFSSAARAPSARPCRASWRPCPANEGEPFAFAFTAGLADLAVTPGQSALAAILADRIRETTLARGLHRPSVVLVDHGGLAGVRRPPRRGGGTDPASPSAPPSVRSPPLPWNRRKGPTMRSTNPCWPPN